MLETIMSYTFGSILLVIMGWFVYMGAHIQEESRKGEYIPLPWEKDGFFRKVKRKIFDKSKLKYRDGDNT